MFSFGILLAFAFAITSRSLPLTVGSLPPSRTAIAISRPIFVKTLPRSASALPFLCLIFAHLEWPDIRKKPPGYFCYINYYSTMRTLHATGDVHFFVVFPEKLCFLLTYLKDWIA